MRSSRFAITGGAALTLIVSLAVAPGPQEAESAASIAGRPANVSAMPVEQQNELIQKRCAVCHTDANPKGGLTLARFDAANPDSAVARMMLVKIVKDGAIAAAGPPVPDAATRDGLVSALSIAAARELPDGWKVDVGPDPSKGGHNVVTASSRQETSSAAYELTLTCNGRTQRGEMTLAAHSKKNRNARPSTLSPGSDGSMRFIYSVDGAPEEKATMYIGQKNRSAPIALVPIPARTLALFVGENVTFPFDRLSPVVRRQLASCVPPSLK